MLYTCTPFKIIKNDLTQQKLKPVLYRPQMKHISTLSVIVIQVDQRYLKNTDPKSTTSQHTPTYVQGWNCSKIDCYWYWMPKGFRSACCLDKLKGVFCLLMLACKPQLFDNCLFCRAFQWFHWSWPAFLSKSSSLLFQLSKLVNCQSFNHQHTFQLTN
jgi:hypothetical protein